MPPKNGKQSNTTTELEEIEISLNFMSGEIAHISKKQQLLVDLVEEVKKQNAEKDTQITQLECCRIWNSVAVHSRNSMV